ncbi:hypothetical protein AGABI2DRAFT_120054 [Agaricus bisporus var. bisporus H97]|uniref:hypothetical protein n=1 Tax=Agaricus bisporus var. bisporus (strain H97 / ATCC MYA-4626 / FGSC 10389) TaxID=936046 RepID=UPI00029F5E9F|nr:hypothetical protein AGABI2DRAFT_120054 [Agaricus bisporus var. bisporus H97]EKV45084.1 hypothetical protein AGABI2DRAFT_120054 [Agaricus bisporus var. bisporus H97]
MGIFPSLQTFQKKAWDRLELTEAQKLMYTAEKQQNFRWVSKFFSGYSRYQLKEEDTVSEDLVFWLREIGQFAEVIYAALPLDKLLDNYKTLCLPGFPLENFYALSPEPYLSAVLPFAAKDQYDGFSASSSGVQLLECIKSAVAQLPAAVFSRWIHNKDCELGPNTKHSDPPDIHERDHDARQRIIPVCRCSRQRQQIIVSICGTSSVQQAIHDLRTTRRSYPGAPNTPAAVHTGFWELYEGMRTELIEGIKAGLQLEPDKCPSPEGDTAGGPDDGTEGVIRELVVTGHSMGGAIAHLLCMDLLSPYSDFDENWNRSPSLDFKKFQESHLQRMGIHSLQIITFGEPRTGNQSLVDHWVALKRRHEHDYGIPVQEWSVKAYNDGVPALPPIFFGFRHFAQQPLYTVKGKTFRVPQSERECGLFHVEPSTPSLSSGSSSQAAPDLQLVPEAHPLPQAPNKNRTSSTMSDQIPVSPLGGHNYYNERDMEGGFLRRMEWLAKSGFDKPGWRERYQTIMQKHHTGQVTTRRRSSINP